MDESQFDALARSLGGLYSRRAALGLIAVFGLGWLDHAAAKKRHRKKHKKKCGKSGSKPVKGKCCTRTVNVDGACRVCDVCPSGCAFSAVQPAIDAANDGDTIVICPGAFAGDLVIEKDLRLVGAGANATLLQGTGADSVVAVDANTVDLENLHITGGASLYGGGIQNAGSTLTLTNVLVSENTAELYGGGVFNNDTLNLVASEVRDNEAPNGGGIYNLTGNTVTCDGASRVTGNTATDTGGGIYNGGTVTLANTANVTGNMPNNCAGGAVANCTG